MHISEFTKPVTAKSLNEGLAKQFGKKIDLQSFTLEQLQDARNKLRTKISQVEMTENFSSVNESDAYAKSRMMLDVLNAEISERGDIEDDMLEGAKPDYIDLDGDGDKKEPMKKAAKDKKSKGIKAMIDAGNKKADAEANESIVREGAEDQAEIVMAAKDMVDRVTNWMEDTAEMQTESMLELADAIRDEMGSEKSEAFVSSVKPSLEAMYSAMESTRGALSSGVGLLTGEGEMPAPMGAEDEMGMEPTVDMDAANPAAGDMDPSMDDLEAMSPAAGGEEAAGREQRESAELAGKIVNEMNDPVVILLQGALKDAIAKGDKAAAAAFRAELKKRGVNVAPTPAPQSRTTGAVTEPTGDADQYPPVNMPRESVDSRNLAKTLASKKK